MKIVYMVFFCIAAVAAQPVSAQEYPLHNPDTSTQPAVAVSPGLPEYADRSFVVHYDTRVLNLLGAQQNPYTQSTAVPGTEHSTTASQRSLVEVTIPTNDPRGLSDIIHTLEQQPGVVAVERNHIRRMTALPYITDTFTATRARTQPKATATPNDPRFSQQWHLLDAASGGITAQSAWDMESGSEDVVIAVIDTGVDIDHPDLVDNMWINEGEVANNGIDDDNNGYVDDVHGYDFVQDDSDPTPSPNGIDDDAFGGEDIGVTHGTHVAGIIAAQGNNDLGVSGVAWESSIMGVRVLDDEGAGTDAAIASGIIYAVDNGAKIIHMSLGGYGSTNTLKTGIEYATSRGILVVAASGNDGVNINKTPFFPACYDHVIGVGSTNQEQVASSFSNYGTDCLDIVAPGEYIDSTLYTNDPVYGFNIDYGEMSGTSMAAPMVSGVASLLFAQNASLTRDDIAQIITYTADDISLEAEHGAGRINAYQAIQGISIASAPDAPTVSAYSNASQRKRFKQSTRHTNALPYFSWQEPADDDGIAGYFVYFGTDTNADPFTAGTFQTERSFTPLEPITGNNTTYYLRMLAQDSVGNVSMEPSTFSYIIDTRVKRPKAPRVVVTATDDVVLSWNPVKKDFVKTYKIVRQEIVPTSLKAKKNDAAQKHTRYRVVGTVTHPKTTFTDTSAAQDTEYRYRIRAIDNLGNSVYSPTARIHIGDAS